MFLKRIILITLLCFATQFILAQNGKINHLSNDFPAPEEEENHQQNQEDGDEVPIYLDSTIVADDTLVFDDEDFDDKTKPRKQTNIVQNNDDNHYSNNKKNSGSIETIPEAMIEYILDEKDEELSQDERKLELLESNITLYPNPVVNQLHVNSHNDIEELVIINIRGQKFDVRLIDNSIDVTHLSEGLYFVKIRIGENIETHKIVVKK